MVVKKVPLIKINFKRFRNPWAVTLLIVLLSVMSIVVYLFNPTTNNIYPPCIFYHLTGYYSPTCGMLRATHHLLHGHVITSLDYNPFVVILALYVGYVILSELDIEIKGKRIFPYINFSPLFYKISIVVILAFWVLRNIPYYPFTILAP